MEHRDYFETVADFLLINEPKNGNGTKKIHCVDAVNNNKEIKSNKNGNYSVGESGVESGYYNKVKYEKITQ